MTPPLLIAAAVTFSASVQAEPSSPSEFRGYQACLEANEAQLNGLTTERDYLLGQTDEGRVYYINGTAWEEGERVAVGISCETMPNGLVTHNAGVSNSRFVQASEGRVKVEVAGN
jgi:hypothetical protein